MQSGLFHWHRLQVGEYSNVGRESEKAKQPSFKFGICGIRSIWLQVPTASGRFPRARPRMYRREVWVAAISLIEAHSHALCSFQTDQTLETLVREYPETSGKINPKLSFPTCILNPSLGET
jgi:hypothetical protein